jgi:hypothetical protein
LSAPGEDDPDDDWQAAAIARYQASYPLSEPSHHAWEDAFRALCQNDDGAPLAKMLRSVAPEPGGGRRLIPPEVLANLAELLDPVIFWSRFGKPPDRKAMRLKATPLSDAERDRLNRDGKIWGEVLQQIQTGDSVSEATRKVGERYDLTERQVTAIWSAARKQQGYLLQDVRRRRRNTETK